MGEYRPYLGVGILCLLFGVPFILILTLTPGYDWGSFIISFDSVEVPGLIVFILVAAIFTPIGVICIIVYIYKIRKFEHY